MIEGRIFLTNILPASAPETLLVVIAASCCRNFYNSKHEIKLKTLFSLFLNFLCIFQSMTNYKATLTLTDSQTATPKMAPDCL